MGISDEIEKIIQAPLSENGFELIETQYRRESGRWVLRLFVDKLSAPEKNEAGRGGPNMGGVTLEDCEKVSELAGNVVDSSELLSGSYVLEVSSPGINRVLKNESHFLRFMGQKVRIALFSPLTEEGKQKNFSGILMSCEEGKVGIEDVVAGRVEIPIASIAKAHLDLI